MNFEYQALALMTIFFLFAWIPVSLGKKNAYGLKWLGTNRDKIPNIELPLWAQRADRAHINLKDNFPAFVVAILLLGATQQFDQATKVAACLYVVGRIGHYVAYASGNVPFRAVFYFLGLLTNLFLLIKVLV